MSIDTYDTLAMIRPGASARYDLDWIERLAREVAQGGGAIVTRKPAFPRGHRICLSQNGVELSIYYSDEPHIALESKEIAAEYGAPCHGSKARFELLGSDLDLVLMNDHQLICERLHKTGDFICSRARPGCCSRMGSKRSRPVAHDRSSDHRPLLAAAAFSTTALGVA